MHPFISVIIPTHFITGKDNKLSDSNVANEGESHTILVVSGNNVLGE
jgi:hypothetical protein